MGMNNGSPFNSRHKFKAAVDMVMFVNHLEHQAHLHHQQHKYHHVTAINDVAANRTTPFHKLPRVSEADEAKKQNIRHSCHLSPEVVARKFRAAVQVTVFTLRLSMKIEMRRKFRASVRLLIHSDALVNTSIQFNKVTFQNAVLTCMAIQKLQKSTSARINERHEAAKRRLCLAVETILEANRHVNQWTHMKRHLKVNHDDVWNFIQQQVDATRARTELSSHLDKVGIGNHLDEDTTAMLQLSNSGSLTFQNELYEYLQEHAIVSNDDDDNDERHELV